MPLVCATALPSFAPATAEARLRQLCARLERAASPRLSDLQVAHCRRFGPGETALRARASRLLARLLALRALPAGAILNRDAEGRPRVTGAPGWHAAFTHSGSAAFCLICAPGEALPASGGPPALDAESWGTLQSGDRAFAAPAPTPAAALRRWILAEALFKALGAVPDRWPAVAMAAQRGAARRLGSARPDGAPLCWGFLAAPGHLLCVASHGRTLPALRLRWLPWQTLARMG